MTDATVRVAGLDHVITGVTAVGLPAIHGQDLGHGLDPGQDPDLGTCLE